MKIIIIGGVAGGASAAARARRPDETAEIIVFERGEHPSFANCGLPYYVGGEIQSRDKLLFDSVDGAILGAQCVGTNGVDKRIDVLATAIQAGMTVYDLEEIEHGFDVVNLSGGYSTWLMHTQSTERSQCHV